MSGAKDNERILLLRNQASMNVDDLTAEVVSGAMAEELRRFSQDIMAQSPGFHFDLKRARTLKQQTDMLLRKVRTEGARDTELMQEIYQMQTMLKEDQALNGGKKMGFFKKAIDKVFHGGEGARQEGMVSLEREYQENCDQILKCEETMVKCINAAKGKDPNSAVYRENERKYKIAKKNLVLLRKTDNRLGKALEEINSFELIKAFNAQQRKIVTTIGRVVGSEDDIIRLLAEMETNEGSFGSILDKFSGLDSVFDDNEDNNARVPDSDFSAATANAQRQDDILAMNGAAVPAAQVEPEDDFAQQTRASGPENK